MREHRTTALAVASLLLLSLIVAPSILMADAPQEPSPTHAAQVPAQPPSPDHAQAPAPHEAEATAQHGNPIVDLLAKLINFGIMAGVLVYFLRSPVAGYLVDRGKHIRADLVKASEMKQAAAEQLAEIDRKMAALPGELAVLREAGASEVAAEEARIRQAAEAERTRLLESTRREIGVQLKIAERELVKHAADLAVAVASERIKATITDADQLRLVDRYLVQVGQTKAGR